MVCCISASLCMKRIYETFNDAFIGDTLQKNHNKKFVRKFCNLKKLGLKFKLLGKLQFELN